MTALQSGRKLMLLAMPVVLLIAAVPGWTAERVALVIGNAAYQQEVAVLKNPVNDAAAMAAALRRLGFEVIAGTDLNEQAFYDKIAAFDTAAREAGIALFFYAGHGLQVNSRNYLAPVDLRLETRQDLRRHAIDLGAVLEVMRSETNVVILDACRNNPLAGKLARSLGLSRATAASRGLARVESVGGTLIAYATEPGSVAADGAGVHSPYTEALLTHIETPGLSVNDLFTRVTAEVLKSTAGEQKPWTHASLSRIVRLGAPREEAPGTSGDMACDREIDLEFWRSVKDSTRAADYETYLSTCPQGRFALLARNRLQALRPPEGAPADSQSTAQSVEARLALSRDDRRLIQLGLLAAGFDPGPADGLIGRGTRDAIKQWQASQDERGTGYLDLESAKELLAAGEKRRAEAAARRQAEAERQRLEREAVQHARLEEEARQLAQREAAERARREEAERRQQQAEERARREAEAAARIPFGPNWIVADNRPCQVHTTVPHELATVSWSGDCLDGKATGEGRLLRRNAGGFLYEYHGQIRDGKISGRGTLVHTSGSRAEGQWRNGRLDGRGILKSANGARYEGQWRDGLPSGEGVFTTADGRRLQGMWRDGCLWRGSRLVWRVNKTEAECRSQ